MKTRLAQWTLLTVVGAHILSPEGAQAGYGAASARFKDWQDAGCNENYPGVGGAASGQSGAGGNQARCTGCTGMARWWVSEPYENLRIADTPLSYRTSSGQEMAFTFYYRQRFQLPALDEVPSFYYYGTPRFVSDYYPTVQPRSMTNATWGNNWTMNIMFWDSQWEQGGAYYQNNTPVFSDSYEAYLFRSEGSIVYFYNFGSGNASVKDARSQVQLQPQSPLGYPVVGTPSPDTNAIYWGSQTNGFRLAYPDGSRDVFGLAYAVPVGTTKEALLTQRIDPQGRETRLGYEAFRYTNCQGVLKAFGYRLRYVVDPDGRTNAFVYPDYTGFFGYSPPNPYAPKEVRDPYGRKAQFGYDFVSGILTSITDAAGLTSSFQYQAPLITNTYWLGSCPYTVTGQTNIVGLGTNSSGWMTNLTTPYGSTSFSFYEVSDPTVTNGFQQRAVYVREPEGAQQLFVYQQTNSLIPGTGMAPTNVPGHSFDHGTSGSTSYYALTYRNTFHWGRRQFAALSSSTQSLLFSGSLSNAISSLTLADYNRAHLKHWLMLGADQASVTEALSSEQEPSPDAAGQIPGPRTWYDYPDKPSAELLGDNPQISCIARILPDGTSQYLTYNFYSAGWPWGGLVSDNQSSYSRTDGTVGVLTNWFAYAANGIDLASVSNSAGQVWRLGYNGVHQVTAITNSLNQVTGLAWDNYTLTTNLAQVSLPSGQTLTLTYYPPAYPPNWPLGNTNSLLKTITLQPQGLLVQIRDYTNGLPRVVTTSGPGLPSLTVTNSWDGLNRLTATVFPDGTSVSNVYDRLYLGARKDRLGHWTGYGYDGLEHLTSITDARSNVTQFGWCGCDALTTITHPLVSTNVLGYNNQGLLTSIQFADASSMNYTLDAIGRVTGVADGLNKALTFGYNNQGLVSAVSNAYGVVARTVYDALDRPIQVTDANNITFTNQFDLLNRLIARIWPDGVSEGFAWATNGLIVHTNRNGKVTRFTRDGAGRLTGVTNANQEVTALRYNSLDRVTDLWDGRTNHTAWNYNEYGWLISKVDALDHEVLRLTRDPNGQITNRWTRQFGDTEYAYDEVGNLKTIVYPNSSISYGYDALNRLKTMVDAVGTTTFDYTAAGRLRTEGAAWANYTNTYGYTQGQRTSMSLDSLSLGYDHDDAWRLRTLTSPAGSFGYGYNVGQSVSPASLVRTITLPNLAWITNHYDSLSRLDYTALVNKWGHVLDGYGYGYDLLGLRTNIVRDLGLATNTVSVGYGSVGQLTGWQAREGSGGSLRLNEQFNYVYDQAGNLRYRTNGGLIQTFSCDGLNQLTTVTRNNILTVSGVTPVPASSVTVNGQPAQTYADFTFARTNVMLDDGNNAFSITAQSAAGTNTTNNLTVNLPSSATLLYDSNGNLTNDGTRSFAYDAENRLLTNWVAGSWKTEFVYDGLGRRRIARDYGWSSSIGDWQLANEARYVYDGWLVIQERDAGNNARVTYTRGLDLSGSLAGAGGIGGLLARTDGSGSAIYHADGVGNITGLMDGQGNMVARYRYGAFGGLVGKWGPMADVNEMQYSSMPIHRLSGLVHFRGREFDTIPQRWLQRDPLGEWADTNPYRFNYNNPLSYIDPDGLAPQVVTASYDVTSGATSVGYADSQFGQGYGIGLHGPLGPGGEIALTTGGSMVPGVGEAMDLSVLTDSESRWWEKGLAGMSLGVNVVTDGFLPNAGGFLKAGKKICRDAMKPIRNVHLAGKVHPRTGIPFDEFGFPDFSGVATHTVKIEQTGNRAADFVAANRAARLSETPPGFTWHHHQDGTTMQLVPTDLHRATGHTGGFSLGAGGD